MRYEVGAMFAWDAIEICALLASETRFAVVGALAHADGGRMSLSKLANRIAVAKRTVRRQISKLEEAGLIEVSREGNQLICQLDLNRMNSFTDFMRRRVAPSRSAENRTKSTGQMPTGQTLTGQTLTGQRSARLAAGRAKASLPGAAGQARPGTPATLRARLSKLPENAVPDELIPTERSKAAGPSAGRAAAGSQLPALPAKSSAAHPASRALAHKVPANDDTPDGAADGTTHATGPVRRRAGGKLRDAVDLVKDTAAVSIQQATATNDPRVASEQEQTVRPAIRRKAGSRRLPVRLSDALSSLDANPGQ